MLKKSKEIKGYLAAVCSAVIYGTMPLIAGYIYSDGVTPPTLVALRSLLALPLLAAIALVKNKSIKIPLKALPSVFLIGFFGMFLTPLLLFVSYQYIDSSVSTVIHFIYPVFVATGGAIILKEKFNIFALTGTVLCVAGILLFYDPRLSLDITGSIFALFSGLTMAVYALLLARFKYKDIPAATLSFYIVGIGGGCSLVYTAVMGQLALPQTLSVWAICVAFALAVTIGAVLLFQQSVFLIGSTKASILSAIEPITSVVLGIAVLGDSVTETKIIGTVLVIAASVVIVLSDIRKKKN